MAVASVLSTSKILPQSPEFPIRRDDDRSGFVAGSDDLEHQVGTSFVDGKISQLIEKEKFRSDIFAELFLQRSVELCGGEHVDHVDRSREPHLDSLFTRHVAQRGQQMEAGKGCQVRT